MVVAANDVRLSGDRPQPLRQIRAVFDSNRIRVYQAFEDGIADAALADQKLETPRFRLDRMSWIKPSFLWMMYRSGWSLKEPGQKRILAFDILRSGFDWALTHAVLSEDGVPLVASDQPLVRVQWDPERDMWLRRLPHRSIQVGLRDSALRFYAREWIQEVSDVTAVALGVQHAVASGALARAPELLPVEEPYPVSAEIAERLGMAIH